MRRGHLLNFPMGSYQNYFQQWRPQTFYGLSMTGFLHFRTYSKEDICNILDFKSNSTWFHRTRVLTFFFIILFPSGVHLRFLINKKKWKFSNGPFNAYMQHVQTESNQVYPAVATILNYQLTNKTYTGNFILGHIRNIPTM